MTGRRIQLKGFKITKAGKLERSTAHLPVNLRLQKQASKRVRVVSRRTAAR
jgi:hypothetical protein